MKLRASPVGRRITPLSASHRRAADASSVLSTCVQIEGRAAYDLEHVGAGGLPLQRSSRSRASSATFVSWPAAVNSEGAQFFAQCGSCALPPLELARWGICHLLWTAVALPPLAHDKASWRDQTSTPGDGSSQCVGVTFGLGLKKRSFSKTAQMCAGTNRFGGLVAMFGLAAICTGRAHSGRQAGGMVRYPGNIGCAFAVSPQPARDLLSPDRAAKTGRMRAASSLIRRRERPCPRFWRRAPLRAAQTESGGRRSPPRSQQATEACSTRCRSSSSTLQRGDARRAVSHRQRSLARPRPMRSPKANDRPRSVKCRLRSRSYNSPNGAMGQLECRGP